MSGIAGYCWGAADRPADDSLLERLLAAMRSRHRGAGPATWSRPGAAIGATAARARGADGRPALEAGADGSIIAFDGRLDNRDELAQALGGNEGDADASLVLMAYARWGVDALGRLLGDYAFALWDERERALLLARDPFGVRPLCYVETAEGLVFASDIAALLACGVAGAMIDEVSVAAYVAGRPPAADRSYLADVRRLPPGSYALARSGEPLEIRSHYRLAAEPAFEGDDPASAFRDIFERAVDCRLAVEGDAAAMLSGGLDSSSIVAVAAPLWSARRGEPLATLSRLYADEAFSERRFVDSVVDLGSVRSIVLPAEGDLPLGDARQSLVAQGGPFLAPNASFTRPIYRAAKALGAACLLDGHGGDEVVSHGWERLGELARSRSWRALWRELDGGDLAVRENRFRLMAGALAHHSIARPVLRRLFRLAASSRTGGGRDGARLVNRDLLAATTGSDRPNAVGKPQPRDHLSILQSDMIAHAFDVSGVFAAREGIELRYPFWDRRLVELCLSLPSVAKLDQGWSRLVLRRAMDGILPPAVQWRRDKLNFGPKVAQGLIENHRALLDDIFFAPDARTASCVDFGEAAPVYRRLLDRGAQADGHDLQAVWRIAMLSIWLRERS